MKKVIFSKKKLETKVKDEKGLTFLRKSEDKANK
jgi:hypothetical protein